MNSLEITKLLSEDPVTSSLFIGCFPCNKLPTPPSRKFSLVVNLSPSNHEGTHWIAIFGGTGNKAYVFDSLGLKLKNDYIIRWLRKHFVKYFCNSIQHQSFTTNTCGGFCIFFIRKLSSGFSFNDVVRFFPK